MNTFRTFFGRIKFINISIRTKLLMIYLLCVLIPTIVFSYASYSYTMETTINEKLIIYRQSVYRISSSIYSNAVSAIELSNTIYADRNMYEHINKEYVSSTQCLDDYNSYMRNAWNQLLPYNTNIALFTVYTNNNTLLNGQHLQRIDSRTLDSDWYGKYISNDSRTAFYCHSDELLTSTAARRMVSYIRKLNYTHCFNHFLKITFVPEMLDTILKKESVPGAIYVVDNNNEIVARSISITYKGANNAAITSFDEVTTDPGQIVIETSVPAMDGWRVVCILDRSFLAEAFRSKWMQMLILILSVTVAASVLIFLISSSFYKRIALLVEHMGKVAQGEYVLIPEEDKGRDEIGSMITSMNSMTGKIRDLIEDVYKAKIRETQLELHKKQSELNALQCQVNPHFMFNVLETIRIKSFLNNEFETSRIIKYMSRMFRKLLMWSEDMIELGEEMKFIREYLEIQHYRYGDELDVEIDADHSLLDVKIPKMTLQTLVDNACEHGFSETDGLKKIKVTVRAINADAVEIKVYDNGKGMTGEQIENILDLNSQDGKGIGIKNVIRRLSLYFDDSYSFKINSEPGAYTEIVLVLGMKGLKKSGDV